MHLLKSQIDLSHYHAVIIPGAGGPRDGLSPIDSLPEWVKTRLDHVAKLSKEDNSATPIILLSAGTFYKPGSLDCNGRNFQESTAMSLYLEKKGVDMSRVFEENASYDTVGNAFFARTVHTDVRGWSNLLVIVNEFHLPRAKLVFDWIFGLSNLSGICYQLSYAYLPDDGLSCSEVISARKEKEAKGFKSMQEQIDRLGINSLSDFHGWLFSQHDLYRSNNRKNLVLKKLEPVGSKLLLETY